MSVAFDEMTNADGSIRAAYATLSRWLSDVPPDVLDYRRKEAEFIFRRIGITFAVYGDSDAQERLIPFDIIPRILTGSEWRRMSRGLEQRVKALNLYLKDIYSRREILKAGIVPEDLVYQNPAFRPEMNGQKRAARPLRPHRRHRRGAGGSGDLLRPGRQCPHALRRLLHAGEPRDHDAAVPGAVRRQPRRAGGELHRRIAGDAEIAGAAHGEQRSRRRGAHPGIYNSAYYEHSFLADKLGVELVEGRDLFVRNDVVYMRTTEGRAGST